MPTLSLKIPEDLFNRLAVAAKDRGMSRSALVREAVESFLRSGGASKGAAGELAADLAGSLTGPPDLSHDPRHLRGFGE